MVFVGRTDLSVEINTKLFTPASSAACAQYHVPNTLFLIPSTTLYSTRGTCLLAMIALCFISLVAGSLLENWGIGVFVVLWGLCILILWLRAPGRTKTAPLLEAEENLRKKVYSILFCGGLILLSLLLTKSNWRGIIVISALLESLSILPCKRNKI